MKIRLIAAASILTVFSLTGAVAMLIQQSKESNGVVKFLATEFHPFSIKFSPATYDIEKINHDTANDANVLKFPDFGATARSWPYLVHILRVVLLVCAAFSVYTIVMSKTAPETEWAEKLFLLPMVPTQVFGMLWFAVANLLVMWQACSSIVEFT